MTNKQKLEKVKNFLAENKIKYRSPYENKHGVVADLYIGKYKILVRISQADDQEYFLKVKRFYHPLFIRDNETKDFVLEKMQNLLIDCMKREHNYYSAKKNKAK